MLSNPTNNLHNRQRQHRRQNSTPNAFEPVKVSNLPNIQRHGGHRRGMSLDTRRRQTPPQDYMVSNTNPGFQTTQQHILRETQQQRLVRPGQQQFLSFDNDENYLHSPNVTPQRQSFDAGCMNQYGDRGVGQAPYYSGPINTTIPVNSSNTYSNNDFNLFNSDGSLTPSAYLDFSAGFSDLQDTNGSNNSRRNSAGRRISGGILDRVAQFENLALQSPHRPATPPSQNASCYFPLTPVDTPHDRMIKHEQTNPRFLDDYDTSMEETIKPKSNQRARTIFDDMRKEAEKNHMPSPPQSVQMSASNSFDSAPMPSGNAYPGLSNANLDYLKNQQSHDGLQYSPMSSNMSSNLSYHSSPDVPQSAIFDEFIHQPKLEPAPVSYPEPNNVRLPDSPTRSEHRRSESVDSINLDEVVTDTGITIDDIATYIKGPDPIDAKWLCLYPDCKKRFGRKENIKSHVQTHLGDRQFQCPHCKKCFVRQHDLKRHAKIHSGVKPYPCQCGNSFARHDALTRHRQRGMCIGAFEGVVKKTVKRGRPRKNRPDDEDRLAKSSRTRSKNKNVSSASSTTSCSESGGVQSPRSDVDILDDKPFGDFDFTQSSSAIDGSSFEYPQPQPQSPGREITPAPQSNMQNASFDFSRHQSPVPTQGVSPQAIQAHSPSNYSTHSHMSIHSQHSHHSHHSHRNSISESIHLPSHPASPHSYHSPPGLCESSSPAASQNYYDLDTTSLHESHHGLSNISEHEDELFLEAFSNATSHEMRDPDLIMGKFEDAFVHGGGEEDLFGRSEDVFFGSP